LIQIVLAVLLAEGHLLIEDVPGVGKTTLAKALAQSIDCQIGRVQFTPDLLPSDLTGGSIYRAATSEFEFRPGPIFNNIVIADEINRASPKTQSALLEAMEESLVTVEGVSHRLPRPFLVVATQNPVELEGTYPLPEAQRDRFLARIEIGYPSAAAELKLLDRAPDTVAKMEPVTTSATLAALIEEVSLVRATAAAKQYVVDLVHSTRQHRDVRLGASPRASIHLLRAAKAIAAMDDRDYVLPDDIQFVAVPVLAHRLILQAEARLSRVTGQDIIGSLVATIPVKRADEGGNVKRLPTKLLKRAS
jgi:MoxR-like ATPase